MNALQLGLIQVASIWAAMNTLIAGYNAVNGTRDRILTDRRLMVDVLNSAGSDD